jgi:uncharacterized short protein YbdD (DUF466 family)
MFLSLKEWLGKESYEKFAERVRKEIPEAPESAIKAVWEKKQKEAGVERRIEQEAGKESYENFAEKIRKKIPEASESEIKSVWNKRARKDSLFKRLEILVVIISANILFVALLFPPFVLVVNDQLIGTSFRFIFNDRQFIRIDAGAWAVELTSIMMIGLLVLQGLRMVRKELIFE